MAMTKGLAVLAICGFSAWGIAEAAALPLEDEQGWSCVDDGNHICGPGNTEGKPAGCYDVGGVLFKAWPCEAWKPSDGYRHGNGTITYGEAWK